jgi:hypothetical protein
MGYYLLAKAPHSVPIRRADFLEITSARQLFGAIFKCILRLARQASERPLLSSAEEYG